MSAIPWHLVWLWFWYSIGMSLYMLKRAHYNINGPNPLAMSYPHYFKRSFVPLLVRAAIDGAIFWMCFTPQLLASGLEYLGWSRFSWVVGVITQFAPCAFFFGHTVDSIADLAVSKISFLNGFLPQMPPPLCPVESANPKYLQKNGNEIHKGEIP